MSDLEDAFAALRASTAAEMEGIDVKAGVLTRARRRPLKWLPLVAAALVILLVWRDLAWARGVTIRAPGGGRIVTAAGARALPLESTVRGDFVVHSGGHPITLEGRGWSAILGTSGTFSVADALSLERGAVRVDDATVTVGTVVIAVSGRAEIRKLEDNAMNKRMLAAVGAIAVISVIAGRAVISSTVSGGGATLSTPTTAVIDGAGRVTMLDDDHDEREHNLAASDDIAVRNIGRELNEGVGASGGYWDEARKVARFRIGGEVFDALSGKPIETFDLQIAPETSSFDSPLARSHHVTGATDGHFVVDGFRLGTWQVTVRAAGYAPSRQTVSLSAVTDDPYIVVPLSAGARLTGVVTDWRGEPVEDAALELGNCAAACGKTRSDAKGAFVIMTAPADTAFTLVASHPRYGNAMLPNLRVSEGETEHVNVTLSGILKVTGLVFRGAEREPVAHAVVKSGDVSTLTDDTGHYQLFMPLDQSVRVRVVTGNPAVEMESYPEHRGAEPIRWVDAKTHVAELTKDFALAMERGRLLGRISDADGRAIANAHVLISNTMGWSRTRTHETFPAETTTDTDGRYRVDDLPAHAGYRLVLARGDEDERLLGTVTLDEPGEVEANFVLASNTLHGRFVDKARAPFPLSKRDCNNIGATRLGESAIYTATRCLDDGSFDIEGLPDGRYRISFIGAQLRESFKVEDVEVDVPAKNTIDVLVDGERSITWTARVTDTKGAFVPGILISYTTGRTRISMSLAIADDGTTTFSAPASLPQINIEAPGFTTTPIDLTSREPKSVIDVHMARNAQR